MFTMTMPRPQPHQATTSMNSSSAAVVCVAMMRPRRNCSSALHAPAQHQRIAVHAVSACSGMRHGLCL